MNVTVREVLISDRLLDRIPFLLKLSFNEGCQLIIRKIMHTIAGQLHSQTDKSYLVKDNKVDIICNIKHITHI